MKTTGKIIAELRKEKWLSQEELANSLFVTRQAISKWESDNGSPDINNLQRIAEFFNVSIDYLLGKENTHNEKAVPIQETNQKPLSKVQTKKIGDVKKKIGRAFGLLLLVSLILLITGIFVPYFSFGSLSVNLMDLFQREYNSMQVTLFAIGLFLTFIAFFIGGYKSAKSRYPKKPLLYLISITAISLLGLILGIVGLAMIKATDDPTMIVEPNGAGPYLVIIAFVFIVGISLTNTIFTYLLASGKVNEAKLFKSEEN